MYDNHEYEAKKIEILERQLVDQVKHDKSAIGLLKLGFVLTFLLYLMFNQHLYIGDATSLGEYFKSNATMAGFAFLMVIVILMAWFLAWVKHHAYLHFGFFGQVGTVVAIVIGFALFAEFFSASANQDAKSTLSLQGNAAYQATINATAGSNTVTPNAGLSVLIAEAEKKFARCEKKLAQGKEPHCDGDKAKLDGLMGSEKRALQAAQEASTAQLETNYARQDKLKADSYNPVIVSFAKAFAGFFGGIYEDWIKTAVVMAMLIVAICFEFLHHWLSKSKEESYNAVQGLELELAKLRGNYIPPVNAEENDNRPTPQGEKQPMGFGTPATAQFKYQQREPETKRPMGFTPWTNEKPTAKKKVLDTGISTWNAELKKSGIDSPADPAMNRAADQAQIDRILERGRGTAPAVQEQSESTVYTVVEQPEQPKAEQSEYANDDSLYQAWKKAVISVDVGTTARGCKDVIEADKGVKISMRESYPIWNVWGEKGLSEGFLSINPDHTPKNRKPKYLLADKYRKGILGKNEEQLSIV